MTTVSGWLVALGISDLPAVNAGLNGAATILLLAGYLAIRRRRESLHKACMLSALATSLVFLTCYVTYHVNTQAVRRFSGPGELQGVYYAVLVTHVVLAACVPVLALRTIYLALRDRRAAHRRLAKWTYPIWMYVSITGVLIYVALYQLWPPKV